MLSIVIPVYNGAKSVERAVESALSQDISEPYEILVIDNASTDGTPDILSKYNNREIRVERSEYNVNMWANHNRAWSLAKEDFILFLHADDVLLPDALGVLQQHVKLPDARRTIVWGSSQFRDFSIHLKKCGLFANEVIGGERVLPLLVLGGLTPSGTMFPRHTMQDLGGFVDIGETKYEGDLASLLHWGLNNLQFKMLSNLIFIRKFASTSLPERSVMDRSLFTAYDKILEFSSVEEFQRVADTIAGLLKSGCMTKFENYCLQKRIISIPRYFKRKIKRKYWFL